MTESHQNRGSQLAAGFVTKSHNNGLSLTLILFLGLLRHTVQNNLAVGIRNSDPLAQALEPSKQHVTPTVSITRTVGQDTGMGKDGHW